MSFAISESTTTMAQVCGQRPSLLSANVRSSRGHRVADCPWVGKGLGCRKAAHRVGLEQASQEILQLPRALLPPQGWLVHLQEGRRVALRLAIELWKHGQHHDVCAAGERPWEEASPDEEVNEEEHRGRASAQKIRVDRKVDLRHLQSTAPMEKQSAFTP